MFIASHPTHIKVTLTNSEWKARPKTERELLLDLAIQHYPDGRTVKLLFPRNRWWKARAFFPELEKLLPKTHQNL